MYVLEIKRYSHRLYLAGVVSKTDTGMLAVVAVDHHLLLYKLYLIIIVVFAFML